jgi:hypothetical protein
MCTASALALALCSLVVAPARADPPLLMIGAPGPSFYFDLMNPNVTTVVFGSERDLNILVTTLATLPPEVTPGNPPGSPVESIPVGGASYAPASGLGERPAGCDPDPDVGCFILSTALGYRTIDTVFTNSVTVGGGVTATVRAGGVQLSSITAPTAESAQVQALAAAGAIDLPGRQLPAVITSNGVIENVSETSATVLTGRDTYFSQGVVVFGPGPVPVGNRGRCSLDPVLTCEGGATLYLGQNDTLGAVLILQDLYLTTTITRTITSSGEIILDIPFAAYGRVHPAAQTIGFDQSDRFVARLLRGGDARLAAPLGGRAMVFLEGAGQSHHYDSDGDIASSHGSSQGVRAGIAVAPHTDLVLGLAGEDQRGRWRLNDEVLPESMRTRSWRLGGFASWSPGPWRLNAAGFGGNQHVASTADSTLGGGTSTARYEANVYGAGVEAGYAIPVGAITLTPSVGVDWLGWHAPAVNEAGGLAPLSVASSRRDQWRGHIGLAADHQGERIGFGGFVRATFVSGDRQGRVIASDGVSDPGSFTIDGPASDREVGEAGAHVDYALSARATLSLSGSARFGDDTRDYAGQIGLRFTL